MQFTVEAKEGRVLQILQLYNTQLQDLFLGSEDTVTYQFVPITSKSGNIKHIFGDLKEC